MDNIFKLIFILALLIVIGQYGTKIYEWYLKRKYERFRDNSAEFISDLYKLKIKWARRGEFMYAKALDSVIGAEMMSIDPEEGQPQSAAGKDYLEKMNALIKEEALKQSDILN